MSAAVEEKRGGSDVSLLTRDVLSTVIDAMKPVVSYTESFLLCIQIQGYGYLGYCVFSFVWCFGRPLGPMVSLTTHSHFKIPC